MTEQEQLVQDFVDAFLSPQGSFDPVRIMEIRCKLDSIDPHWRETLNEPLLNRVRYWTAPFTKQP